MVLLQFAPDFGTWSRVIGSQPPPTTPAPARKQKPRKQTIPVYAVGKVVECCSYVMRSGSRRDPRWREGVITKIQHINGVTWFTIPAANGFPFMYTADNVRFPAVIRPDAPARRLA